MTELGQRLTEALSEETDEHVVCGLVEIFARIASHNPSELTEHGLAERLLSLLDSRFTSVRAAAARCVAALCEDEHGLAPARLLDAGLVPACARLALAERSVRAHDVAAVAVGIIARIAQESTTMRVRVVQGEVHGVLLAFAGPQLPNAPPAVHQAQLFALEAIYELGKTSEFKGALSEVEGFFSLLFTLRDCDTKGVIELSHRIASHWSDDFFGWVWECCALCKRVAARLMLDRRRDRGAEAKAAARTANGVTLPEGELVLPARDPEEIAAGPPPSKVVEDASGADRYVSEMGTLREQLREFLAQADDVARGLLRAQAELDEGCSACERYVRLLRQKNLIEADPADAPTSVEGELPAAEAFASRCRSLGHSLLQCKERVRTSSRQLLLHCNLLLDCELAVKRAERHLKELEELVSSSKALEVSYRWKLEGTGALQRALIALALRLELYTRGLITQREGAGSDLSASLVVLKAMPSVRADAAALERDLERQGTVLSLSGGAPIASARTLSRVGSAGGDSSIGVSASVPALQGSPTSSHGFDMRSSYAARLRPARTLRGVAHAASTSTLVISAAEARRPRSAAPGGMYRMAKERALNGGGRMQSSSSQPKLTPFKSTPFGAGPKNNLQAAARGDAAARAGPPSTAAKNPFATAKPSDGSKPRLAASASVASLIASPRGANAAVASPSALVTPLPRGRGSGEALEAAAGADGSAQGLGSARRASLTPRSSALLGSSASALYDSLQPIVGRPYQAMPCRASAEAATERKRASRMAAVAARGLGGSGSAPELTSEITNALLGSAHVDEGSSPAASGTPALSSRRPAILQTIALPKDQSRLPARRGLPDAEELRQLAGELKRGSMGSRERLARLRQVFDAIDEDSSGQISMEEMAALFAHAEMAIDQTELKQMFDDSSLDTSGQLEFVEFIEAVQHIGRRARAELRARAEQQAQLGEDMAKKVSSSNGGTVLDAMLAESRQQQIKAPPCPQMDAVRRRARVLQMYDPSVSFKPAAMLRPPAHTPESTRGPDPNDGGKHRVAVDERSAVQLRRSDLGDAFPHAAQYMAALLLHAYLEIVPAAQQQRASSPKRRGSAAAARHAPVPLEMLHRLQAWSRLSAFPETPPLTGAQWQLALARWLKHVNAVAPPAAALPARTTGYASAMAAAASAPAGLSHDAALGRAASFRVRSTEGSGATASHGPALALYEGVPCVIGVRRVHPSERRPALHGWDQMQLLSYFRVGKLADLPNADEVALRSLPLPQIWPTLGNAHEAAVQALAAPPPAPHKIRESPANLPAAAPSP